MKYKSFNLDKISGNYNQNAFSQCSSKNVLIEGYASVFDVVDHEGEIIHRGAFSKGILKNIKKNFKLLWQHSSFAPVGNIIELQEDNYGLFMRADMTKMTLCGNEIFTLLSENIVDSLSVGFIPEKTKYDTQGRLNVLEATLHEISIVTFPANPMSKITYFNLIE